MSAMKIKKGDTVKVIAGKDNGKEGKVLAVNAKDNTVLLRISTKLQNTANHLLQISRAESLQKKLHCTSPTLCWLLMDRLQE